MTGMEEEFRNNPLSDLFAELKSYLDLRLDQAKLSVAENLARILSKVMYFFAMLLMICLALGFLAVCFCRWMSHLTGSQILGPAITFGCLMLMILILYTRRDRLMLNQNLRIFIKMLFKSDKDAGDRTEL